MGLAVKDPTSWLPLSFKLHEININFMLSIQLLPLEIKDLPIPVFVTM
jgi:hypothetical protein